MISPRTLRDILELEEDLGVVCVEEEEAAREDSALVGRVLDGSGGSFSRTSIV